MNYSGISRCCLPLLILFLCGCATVLAFAPLAWSGILLLALAALFYFEQRSTTTWQAAWRGFAFGLGYFIANAHWIYISMHQYGGMPSWMAAGCVLAFSAFMAAFPAMAGALAYRLPCSKTLRWTLFPVLYLLAEWGRSTIFTGFPWASTGTAQVGLLAGWFPILGAYGVGLITTLLIARTLTHWRQGLVGILLAVLGSVALTQIPWTQPVGQPVTVSLIQGGVSQAVRWDNAFYNATLERYFNLTQQTKGQIVLLPEGAIPGLYSDIPADYLLALRTIVASHPHGKLLGGFNTGDMDRYYNSLVYLDGQTNPTYRKQHLVPFGEYVPAPWAFGWMYDFMKMPMAGFQRGNVEQDPITLAPGLRIAGSICYEDAFGDELRRNARGATLLANISNMGWFDGSWAAEQHLQMSRARALENGRWMIRATNTGATAIINHRGQIIAQLPAESMGILEGIAEPRTGTTPYMIWGDLPILLLLLGWCGLVILLARRQNQAAAR